MADTGANAFGGDGSVQPYRTLDTAKRKAAGVVYVVMAAVAGVIAATTGIWLLWVTTVLPLLLIAAYQFLGAWKLAVTDMEAIATAGERASFGVGHGSATLGFAGLRARPVWQVLVFGDGPAPRYQALVTIDGVSGDITGIYEEPVEQP
jgi:hypothetical protein